LIRTSKALEVIAGELAPYIGRTLAEASLKLHCERLGIARDGSIGREDLDRLLDRLLGALSVFVGAQRAQALLASIRHGVQAGVRVGE
jgi:hypothetical protein